MADSSEEALWRSFVQQDKYLRKVLQRIWMASQDLNMSTEYTGVESMITIDKELPIKYRVLQQENRLEALNVLATELAPIQALKYQVRASSLRAELIWT